MLNKSQILQIQRSNEEDEIIINIQWGTENQLTLDINDSPIYDNDYQIDKKIENEENEEIANKIMQDGLKLMRKEAKKLQKEIQNKTRQIVEIKECKF